MRFELTSIILPMHRIPWSLLLLGFFLFTESALSQQDAKLANYYYQAGEYEKSAELFKKLSDRAGFNDYYFGQYIESLMALEDYSKAEKSIEHALKTKPNLIQLYVTHGNLLERLGKTEEADDRYRKAIDRITSNRGVISSLGNSFMRLTKYELALETFEKGEALSGNSGLFAYSIAEIYRRKNETEKMIEYYLKSPMAAANRISSVQNYFNRYLTKEEDFDVLRSQLYKKVQEFPEDIFYPEMIQWVFVRNRQYNRALRQAQALDRRLNENGNRIYTLGQISSNHRDYDTAIKAYSYIIEFKNAGSSYYMDAKKELLESKRKKLISSKDYSKEDLLGLKEEYEDFLTETGRGRKTALIVLKLAQFEALYLNELGDAINTLNDLIHYPGVNNYIRANAKLDLGDYYLMIGEVWESTLLYSQVDKEFKEDHLGEKARFKNAKLSYFIGDFEWAQEQFDILKAATSKLISNDAIDMSVFIMDNANLDTTYAPLKLFAEAELLFFQNRISEAFVKLDSITTQYPDHSLQDDLLFVKADNYKKLGQFDLSIELYQQIIESHPDEIRADNAIFALASIYQNVMKQPREAMKLYEKLFLEYTDSTFAIEARKKYRVLRGDSIQ